jgi:Ca2+-dependent lipid-binding protein
MFQERMLHIAVWDWDRLSKNDFIGALSFSIKQIESGEVG